MIAPSKLSRERQYRMLAVCGEKLSDEIQRCPEYFSGLHFKKKLGISDKIYLGSIYLYKIVKMTMLTEALILISLYGMSVVWPNGNIYWLLLLSGLAAFAITIIIEGNFFTVLISIPLLTLAGIASVIGGWFGL